MTLPATPSKPARNGKPEPKSLHLSRAERREERNARKHIIKIETAKHRSRVGKRCEKNVLKNAEKKARKAAKAKARARQHVAGAVSDTSFKTSSRQYSAVSRAPSIFNLTPETAKAIADAAQSDSPSHYSRKVGTPLLLTPSQGGHCKVERSLTDDFLRVREVVEKEERALLSTPDSISDLAQESNDEWIGLADEIEGQDSEYDLPTIHPGAYLEFFGDREEKHTRLLTPDSRGDVEATHVNNPKDWDTFKQREVEWIKREGDPHRIAFDEQGNEMRALSYWSDFDSNENDPGDGHDPFWDNLDFRANPSEDEAENVHEAVVLSDDEPDSDVEELPFIDLTQEDTVMVETDDEDDVYEIDTPTCGLATPNHIIDLTEVPDPMEETYGDNSDQESVAPAREPLTSVITDLTRDKDFMDETEDEDDVQRIDLPALAPARNRVDLPVLAPSSNHVGLAQEQDFMETADEDGFGVNPTPTVAIAPNQGGDAMDVTGDEQDIPEVNAPTVIPTAAEPVDAVAGSSQNNPQVIDDDSEEAHEAKLELSLQQELLRTQERREAETRDASRLEQLLARDHSSLTLTSLSDEYADVRDSFNFIRGMHAEQSDLNTKASVIEKRMRVLMAPDPVPFENRRKAEILGKLWYANEKAATYMVCAENKFRDRASKENPRDMRVLLMAMKHQLLEMFEKYDARVKEYKAALESEAER
ncbi:hypothetical protein HBI24_039320 [Parastagonospora nodorum]|nr:hypothetical protein HBH53_016480 [Parastagonospora nodorum]KAH4040594.1 hypothetical protein HBI09_029980 [Parastagonospora nodorum]KAH4196283.1 hypothetical protein HBI95_190400 [Parastagonospora nodorum]KAH4196512.1 hypothetical protein HBH42_066590 [Parastagonospora nodorum]KAH4217157.1 hypothetical protein HBI06_218110 [Parastagonospora nodorum]